MNDEEEENEKFVFARCLSDLNFERDEPLMQILKPKNLFYMTYNIAFLISKNK
jgi:hypothetical protein